MSLSFSNTDLSDIALEVKQRVDVNLLAKIHALPKHPTTLAEAMEYALVGGGKRMRPLLCHLVCESLGLDEQDALSISCAIECIHAYSLIHDDLPAMDDDDLRRGRPTCHVIYGDAVAILAGDALQALAYEILCDNSWIVHSDSAKLQLVNILSRASGYQGMCGGQAIDLAATGKNSAIPHEMETLTLLHKLKTGALLKACVSMPLAITPSVNKQDKALFEVFADSIGLAFQVQDDILDEVGSEQQIGKPKGSDIAQHKHTYPALLGVNGAKQELTLLYEQALQALDGLPYNTLLLKNFCDLMVQRDH